MLARAVGRAAPYSFGVGNAEHCNLLTARAYAAAAGRAAPSSDGAGYGEKRYLLITRREASPALLLALSLGHARMRLSGHANVHVGPTDFAAVHKMRFACESNYPAT
jgi:hypothetical protein